MKQICIPTLTERSDKVVLKYENTPISVIHNKAVEISGDNSTCGRIGAFYSVLEEKIQKWIENDFDAYARSRYITDPSPRKKYRYVPLELTKDMTSLFNETENTLKIRIRITLNEKNKLIAEKNIIHLWDLKSGYLHMPRKEKSKKRTL